MALISNKLFHLLKVNKPFSWHCRQNSTFLSVVYVLINLNKLKLRPDDGSA